MNLSARNADRLVDEILEGLAGQGPPADLGVAPPFPYLERVARRAQGSPLAVGSQDVHWENHGAFTGAVSVSMVADSGASFVLVGHSERRSLFGESDENVGRKTVAVANAGLDVVVCVGETEAERRAALTHEVVERQVRAATAGVAPADRHRVTVAYEPVWAIGTGRTPLGEEIDSVHRWIREVLASQWNAPREANLILYGGSVNPENARAILSLPHVDGALVGGASLESSLFLAIAAAAGLPGPGPA